MKRKIWINLMIVLGLLVSTGILSPTAAPTASAETTATILYVKKGIGGDCSSWAQACGLYVAMTNVVSGTEIWVASGTYGYQGGREVSIPLINGVAIYGGFDGTETSRDQRNPDPATNGTVLSGDIGTQGDDSDNRYHVVTAASGTDSTAILDGFTITGGNANGIYPYHRGAGMYNHEGSPKLINVTFSGNSAGEGGGMYNWNGSPVLTDVGFSDNSAQYGGGMYNWDSSPTLDDVTFSGNWARYTGGGMANWESSPRLDKVTFSDNSTDGQGGGMYNSASSPTLLNVTFSGNSADYGGGMGNTSSSPELINVIFSGNSAAVRGGGVRNNSSSPTLVNVTFSGNSAYVGGGMGNTSSSPTLVNVTFSDNSADYGGGMGNRNNSSPMVANSILWGNSATSSGNQIHNEVSTTTISYSLIQGGCPPNATCDEYTINADPQFVNAANGDLHLRLTSPAIDAGDDSAVPEGVTTDLDGNPRIDNGTVDLGAYEADQNNKPTAYFQVKDAMVEGPYFNHNEGNSFQLVLGDTMTFDATRSSDPDPDGSIVAYEWKSSTSLEPLSTDQTFSMTDELPTGIHTISLRVQDDDGAWSEEITTRITVRLTPVVYVEGYQAFEYAIPQAEHYYDLLDPKGTKISCNVLVHSATGDIMAAAGRLGEEIQALKEDTHAKKVDIVAHSMGGVISRWYMQSLGGNDVRKFVSVGSPHHGLDWMVLSHIPGGIEIFGEAGRQMSPHSPFLFFLNRNWKCATWGDGIDYINPNVQYTVIASKGILTPEHRHLQFSILGIPFHVVYDWYPFNGDFVVSANSSRLDGVPFLTSPSSASRWHWDLDEPHIQIQLWDCIEAILHSSTSEIPAACDPLNPSMPGLLSQASVQEAATSEVPAASQWAEPISGAIATGGTNLHISHVDAATQRVIFQLLTPCELGLNLVSPDGQVFNSSYSGYSSGPGQILYEIPDPEPGDWTLNVPSAQPDECEYTIQALSETNLFVGVGTDQTKYKPYDSIMVFAYAQDAGAALPEGSITARIQRPAGVQELLPLWDDGTHGDELADDGLYANAYDNTAENGVYGIEVVAQIMKDGVSYTRKAATSVSVALSPDLVIEDSDITLSNANPQHGETINITAAIHNTGDADAQAAEVLFYDGDPGESGEQIGEATVDVPVGGAATASLTWTALRGVHNIHLIISPFNDFLELSYDNNRAQATVTASDTEPPTAEAGPDQTVLVGMPVFFDGSLSTDNAGITEYRWDVDTSLDSSGDGIPDNDADLMGDAPVLQGGYGTPGDYVVKLSVNDADGNGPASDTLTVHATTEPDSEPPVANAGPNQTAKLKQPIFFDASLSSDNFAIASYQWDTDTAVDTDQDGVPDNDLDLMGVHPTLTSGYARSGTYTVKLVVDDVAGNGPIEDLLVVTVVNGPPTAQAGGPYVEDENAFATFDASGSSDPDGDSLRYHWDFDNDGQWDSEWSDLPWAYYAWPDDYAGDVRVEVSDGDLSSVATAAVTVNNVAPKATLSLAISANEGEGFTLSMVNSLDQSTVDTLAGFSYSFDCGEGSGYGDWSSENTITCPTSDDELRTVRGKILDKDGGETEYTASILVNNMAPAVTVGIDIQTVQYSDYVSDVTFSATDVAADTMTASASWSRDGDTFEELPDFLALSEDGCSASGNNTICTWTLSGNVGVEASEYTVRLTVEDEDWGVTDSDPTIIVTPEDASVSFHAGNPVAVQVAEEGGDSGLFELEVRVRETYPDNAPDESTPYHGEIGLGLVSMKLVPVGPGGEVNGNCTVLGVFDEGYDAFQRVVCGFDAVPVNTYLASLTVDGSYYAGYGEDVLVIYDPSLGFATGGGEFNWPGTDERTSFGFTMEYNKSGSNVKGSLLLVRHLADGSIYQVKSNALYGLSLGIEVENEQTFDWTSFSGKATYLEPGWPEAIGNHEFLVYVEDRYEPGSGADHFWIEVYDKDDNRIAVMSMARPATENAQPLQEGNIFVPN